MDDKMMIMELLADYAELCESARAHGLRAMHYIELELEMTDVGLPELRETLYSGKARSHARLAATHARRLLELEKQVAGRAAGSEAQREYVLSYLEAARHQLFQAHIHPEKAAAERRLGDEHPFDLQAVMDELSARVQRRG